MKFKVRSGFVVHDTKVVELDGQKSIQTKSYFGGESVDFDKETALQHAHRLEADGKEAKEFFAEYFPEIPAAAQVNQSAGGVDVSGAIQALAAQLTTLAASQAAVTELVGQVAEVVQAAVSAPAPDDAAPAAEAPAEESETSKK